MPVESPGASLAQRCFTPSTWKSVTVFINCVATSAAVREFDISTSTNAPPAPAPAAGVASPGDASNHIL